LLKRYWWMLLIAVLPVASISTYYIHAASASWPAVKLEHQSGDPQTVNNIDLHITHNKGGMMRFFTIHGDVTEEAKRKSPLVLTRRTGTIWQDLIDRYPRFMRGKKEIDGFYEDDSRLVYAGLKNIKDVEISILDKSKNTTNTFQVSLPHVDKYTEVSFFDVQFLNGQILILTKHFPSSDYSYQNDSLSQKRQFHLYTISPEEGHVITEETLFTKLPAGSNDPSSIFTDGQDPLRYSIFIVYENMENHNFRTEGDKRVFYSFDLESKQERKLDIPELNRYWEESGEKAISYEVSTISYVLQKKEEPALRYYQYSIPDQTVTEQTIPFENPDRITDLTLKGNRLYVTADPIIKDSAIFELLIYDIQTAKLIYQGAVLPEDDSPQSMSNIMYDIGVL
jgi:hypothetical protein